MAKHNRLESVVETAVEETAPVESVVETAVEAVSFRVWAHGGVYRNGAYYAPGSPISLPADEAERLGEVIVRG